jgi:two-component system, OmpR family, phosphate regulon sensor histidine kinase PhoR
LTQKALYNNKIKHIMNRTKWFLHPIFILVFSILALGLSLFLYIYWYMEVSTGLEGVIRRFNLDRGQVLESQTWVVILVLSILVGIILTGIFLISAYNLKIFQLYRLQNNFINNFTHELKTPVTSLKLYLETFLKHDLSKDDQHKYIHYMINDADRLSANINRILNLAKIESKSYEVEFVTLELVETINLFLKNNRHLFMKCKINVFNPAERSFPYKISLSLFEMLLMNLLTNAIKYNNSDIPEIDITFVVKKNRLNIIFEDNGIGFDKSNRKKIFKKFFQIGRSDDMTAKGSGIGLYLVENIAKIHKGKVTAESEGLDRGSLFTLILPY